ncbi:MAG: phage tail protein [Caldicoprobacter oshimai]
MSFGVIAFTNRGRALQAKAQAGAQLVFTRIAVGDGQLGGQAIADLTALIHEVKSIPLNKFKTLPNGKAVIGGVLSNQDLTTGFYWRELGIFAQDPDLGEILYCYGNAGELAEYIPGPGGAEILEKQIDVVVIVENVQNISATIDQSLVFETPAGAQEKAAAALEAARNYTDQATGNINQAIGEINQVINNVSQDLASHKNESASLNTLGHVKHATLIVTLDTNWEGSSPPFTKTQPVEGITPDDNPIIDIVLSGDYVIDRVRLEEWSSIYRAVTATNQITFYATSKPEVELPLQIKVVR